MRVQCVGADVQMIQVSCAVVRRKDLRSRCASIPWNQEQQLHRNVNNASENNGEGDKQVKLPKYTAHGINKACATNAAYKRQHLRSVEVAAEHAADEEGAVVFAHEVDGRGR